MLTQAGLGQRAHRAKKAVPLHHFEDKHNLQNSHPPSVDDCGQSKAARQAYIPICNLRHFMLHQSG